MRYDDDTSWSVVAAQFMEVLQKAVDVRVQRAPSVPVDQSAGYARSCGTCSSGAAAVGGARVAVLFSGGVDSAVLAALTDRWVVCYAIACEWEWCLNLILMVRDNAIVDIVCM